MGIPLWREPSESDALRSAAVKDATAAARSAIRRQGSIRRPSRHRRGAGGLSYFHTQILDEIQRGLGETQTGVRSPVLNLGVSEDGLDLDSSRREALGRPPTRPIAPRRGDTSSRRPRMNREMALSDLLSRSESHSQSRPEARVDSPSLTPNFAPAIAYHTSVPPHPPSESIRHPTLPPPPRLRIPDIPDLTSDILLGFPNVLRNGSVNRPTRASAIDGLGDRQRSVSPDGDHENDAWETLLTTITPDASLPSNDNSFSSSTTAPTTTGASRNGLRRYSATSSQTLPPVHMALDPYPDHLNPCDLSSSDDEDTPVNYHRVIGPSGLPIALRRPPGLPSTMGSQPTIPTISFAFSDSSSETDLQQMQAILDRLARRQDIPDDWWAGAGLSRNLGRGLNTGTNARTNNHERAE
ncbi:hypothetical protein N7478_006842 [Penicillium angulare]|uniref:uncharacterized protein n=1 Tax=Penicillium angulare TaxID=116970 RepID=UPI00253F87DB|nr:uncharacterized protein N7478_006842 [Penicillium angulare]KAJ5281470.1 hypothetical protein N7478_006842 [Penicillium angulare]